MFKSFLTKEVPMWRAILALGVGVTISTLGMYNTARQAIEMMSISQSNPCHMYPFPNPVKK